MVKLLSGSVEGLISPADVVPRTGRMVVAGATEIDGAQRS